MMIKRNPATGNWEYTDGTFCMTDTEYYYLDLPYWSKVASELSSEARKKYPKNKQATYESIMNGSGAFI